MICEKLKKDFDLQEIRKHGIEIMFCVLFLIIQITNHDVDMRRGRIVRGRAIARTGASRAGRTRGRSSDINWDELC